MKKIVLTGGGSSGHVTPNIALIPVLKKLGYEVHYIGSLNGIEKQLIEKEGLPYHPINAGKLRRYFDLKNVTDIFRVMDGFRQSIAILGKLKPDVVFSKGGYVSCPVVWAAWVKRIPVIIHESDITPGLTNKLSMPFAKKICFTFPESQKHMPPEKGILTGIPIRDKILRGNKNEGMQICGFTSKKPVIMVMGGSQGAESINEAVRNSLNFLLKYFHICHVCGKGNISRNLINVEGYKQFEYVQEEQPHLFALADLMVSRAGATSLFEILALRKPNLLIPLSKKSSRGDQILNAQSFEKQGLSQVLPEENLNEQTLIEGIMEIYQNRDKYVEIMKQCKTGNGVDEIIKLLES